MIVPPVPICALVFAAQTVEFTVLVMPLDEPHAIRSHLAIIPWVVIRMILVVIPRMRGASARQNRRKHRCAQHQRPEISLDSQHFAILLRIFSFSSRSYADHAAMRVLSPG